MQLVSALPPLGGATGWSSWLVCLKIIHRPKCTKDITSSCFVAFYLHWKSILYYLMRLCWGCVVGAQVLLKKYISEYCFVRVTVLNSAFCFLYSLFISWTRHTILSRESLCVLLWRVNEMVGAGCYETKALRDKNKTVYFFFHILFRSTNKNSQTSAQPCREIVDL